LPYDQCFVLHAIYILSVFSNPTLIFTRCRIPGPVPTVLISVVRREVPAVLWVSVVSVKRQTVVAVIVVAVMVAVIMVAVIMVAVIMVAVIVIVIVVAALLKVRDVVGRSLHYVLVGEGTLHETVIVEGALEAVTMAEGLIAALGVRVCVAVVGEGQGRRGDSQERCEEKDKGRNGGHCGCCCCCCCCSCCWVFAWCV